MSEGSILDKLSDAAATASERIKETFESGQDSARDAANRAREQLSGRDERKDRTQTSASEDAHDLASAAEDKTNRAIDRTQEATQDVSNRADATYKESKGLLADEWDKVTNAIDDIKATAAEKVPGRDTQDPRVTKRSGLNPGFETARDYSEKAEDV